MTFDRGNSAAPFVVTIVDGKVRSVSLLKASRAPAGFFNVWLMYSATSRT